jgi:ribose 1,5-bisphosphokinase
MRYALYFAPQPGSPWAEAGNGWLGRDAERGIDIAQAQVPRIPAVLLSQLTSGARRYGFHATLKAPFHLAPGFSEANL